MKEGKYVIIEGADGVGKTTQLLNLESNLRLHGYDTAVTHEPGGTMVGDQVRKFLLDDEFAKERDKVTQLLGYNFARAILVRMVIARLLKEGKNVLSDRSFCSTIAYQAFAEGVDLDKTIAVCELAMSGHMPDRIFILNVPINEARRRLLKVGVMNHYDRQSAEFHQKIREGYRWCADHYKDIVTVLDGTQDEQVIASTILELTIETIDNNGISWK